MNLPNGMDKIVVLLKPVISHILGTNDNSIISIHQCKIKHNCDSASTKGINKQRYNLGQRSGGSGERATARRVSSLCYQ